MLSKVTDQNINQPESPCEDSHYKVKKSAHVLSHLLTCAYRIYLYLNNNIILYKKQVKPVLFFWGDVMGNRIRDLRDIRNMSQVRLAIELEVSQETVSAYESGKHFPSYATLVKLSEIFGVSIDYLMGRTDEPAQKEMGLTTDEQMLLDKYRRLNAMGRAKVVAYLDGISER